MHEGRDNQKALTPEVRAEMIRCMEVMIRCMEVMIRCMEVRAEMIR